MVSLVEAKAVKRGKKMGMRRRRRKSYTILYWHFSRLAVPQMRQVGKQGEVVRGGEVGDGKREVKPHGHLRTTNSCVPEEEEEEAWKSRRHKVSILKSLLYNEFYIVNILGY
jgi:hypothetical protein